MDGHPNSAQPNHICEIPHRVPNTDATYVRLSASGMEEIASRDQENLAGDMTHTSINAGCLMIAD